MALLNLLYNQILQEASSDLSELPEDVVKEVQKNIRDGAKDQEQNWANALELVHKAYEVAGVQRPTPDMVSAWKQYEENLQYAVEQLAKFRGLGGDWRMSSVIFHEAMEKRHKFRVVEMGHISQKSHIVEAKRLEEIIEAFENKDSTYDVKVNHSQDPENPNMATITFSKWGIRKKYKVKIQQL